jgi:hypothetical protein
MSQPYAVRTSVTPVVTVGAYVAGNCVGGTLTFPAIRGALGAYNPSSVMALGGMIQTAVLRDKSGNPGTYDLFLFDALPTAQTDHAAVALVAADLAKCIGVVSFPATMKLGAAATIGVSMLSALEVEFVLQSGGNIYGVLVTRGTPTYASTSDVSVDVIAQVN